MCITRTAAYASAAATAHTPPPNQTGSNTATTNIAAIAPSIVTVAAVSSTRALVPSHEYATHDQ